MRVGIDLLWVRPEKNGGGESYIRNILDGIRQCNTKNVFILFLSLDNAKSFDVCDGFERIVCPFKSDNSIDRVIWENIFLKSYAKKKKIDFWFFPVYSRPFYIGDPPCVTVIHDIQAIHYPEYFSQFRNLYFRFTWKKVVESSTKIITISEFCKKDIVENLGVAPRNVEVLYNPIVSSGKTEDFERVSRKYGLEKKGYFYTVCSLAKHKNLMTILKAIKLLKDYGKNMKLVISGVKANAEGEVFTFIKENNIADCVIYTGFVTSNERNTLYDNCQLFLFPSVFEGFGMPPVEAMIRRVPVLTTKEASIYEVTEGKADYVDNPFNEKEWADNMLAPHIGINEDEALELSEKYNCKRIAEEYIKVFDEVYEEKANRLVKD